MNINTLHSKPIEHNLTNQDSIQSLFLLLDRSVKSLPYIFGGSPNTFLVRKSYNALVTKLTNSQDPQIQAFLKSVAWTDFRADWGSLNGRMTDLDHHWNTHDYNPDDFLACNMCADSMRTILIENNIIPNV